jgi:hypothetical protein
MDARLQGLVVCPVCDKVFMNSEWKLHARDEMKKRVGTNKPQFKGKDGIYRCVVPGCTWGGKNNYKQFKDHVRTHDYEDICRGNYPPEVILLNNQLNYL